MSNGTGNSPPGHSLNNAITTILTIFAELTVDTIRLEHQGHGVVDGGREASG
jgi:hypothetical protein